MKYFLVKNQEAVFDIFNTEIQEGCRVILCVGELSELVLFYNDIFIAAIDLESTDIKIDDLQLRELQIT